MNKKLTALFIILFAGIFIFAWFHFSQPEPPIRIGYIGSLTGKFSDLGTTCRDGALMAVEEINASNGINGRKLQLVVRDDQSSSDMALTVTKQLIAQNVQAIIGPLTSASAKEILDLINDNEILTIGPVIAGDFMAKKEDFFIKMYTSTSIFGSKMGELAASDKGLKRLAIISDDDNLAYTAPIATSFEKKVNEFGGEVVESIHFNSQNNLSFSKLADEIIASNPDGLLMVTAPLATAMILQQLRLKGSNIQCFSSSWAASKELITEGGSAVEGLLLYIAFNSKSTLPSHTQFINNYKARFAKAPNYCSSFNHDAVFMLAEALKEASKGSQKKLNELIIEGSPYKGIQGEFDVDKNGDISGDLFLQTIKDGKFIIIDTP